MKKINGKPGCYSLLLLLSLQVYSLKTFSQNETSRIFNEASRGLLSLSCKDLLMDSLANSQTRPGPGINPDIIPFIEKLVEESRLRDPKLLPDKFKRHDSVEKFVRGFPGLTISLMNRRFATELRFLPEGFAQKGFVVGDPHDGNFRFRFLFHPENSRKDRFDYGLKDFDEAGLGILSLDFSRYLVYLLATHDQFKKFDRQFLDQVIDSYLKGLSLDDSPNLPSLLQEQTQKNPEEVREKIKKYAKKRTDPRDLKFTSEVMKDELEKFRFRNLEQETVAPFRASNDRNVSENEREQIKAQLLLEIKFALENHFGPRNISIHDIAVSKRNSGGSAGLQRFWLSIQVRDSYGQFFPMVVELKRNSERSGWTDTFRNSLTENSSARYSFALNAAHFERGFAEEVVLIGGLDYLLRIKGAPDLKLSDAEVPKMILYNSYLLGRIHGSQGSKISIPYLESVKSNLENYREFIKDMSLRVFHEIRKAD